MTAIWILAAAVITALCYHEYKLECREYRKKHGMSKAEFRHYRKIMTDSAYRTANKKSPENSELFNQTL